MSEYQMEIDALNALLKEQKETNRLLMQLVQQGERAKPANKAKEAK